MRLILATFAACAAFGQTAEPPLSFEVASVKPASAPIQTKDEYTEGYNAGMRAAMAAQGLRVVGNRVTVTDNTLKDLIRMAYQLKDHQISGPSWIASEKYEVAAILPAGANRSQAPAMLRTLIEQRFHLVTHRETRKMTGYALVAGKGGAHLTAVAGPESRTVWAGSAAGRLRAKCSTATLADMLGKALDGPVSDETGLAGIYEFELTYAPELSATAESGPTLAEALQKQTGLKLEKREVEVQVLVIDRADKVPAEN